MLRAKFILYQTENNTVNAIYGGDAKREDLEPVARQLRELPGMEAKVLQIALDSPDAPRTFAIVCGVRPLYARRPPMLKLKELTNPELPVALGRFNAKLLLCDCGYLSSSYNGQFLDGFDPEDHESFWLKVYAGMKRHHADEFLDQGGEFVEPYDAAAALIELELKNLGAYASEVYIQPQRDTRPCTHT